MRQTVEVFIPGDQSPSSPAMVQGTMSISTPEPALASTAPMPLDQYYRFMIGAARASDLLRADVRSHFMLAQQEIGFQYIRFHGVFNDEMCVLDPKEDGTKYNFTYIDNVFDFLLGIGLKPFVELSFMPTAIASGQATVFFYRANVTPPRDYTLWGKLIEAFMRHIIARYSVGEVRTWYFEVWNEPNMPQFWAGSFDDYMELYRTTAASVKRVEPTCKVGGPTLNSFQYNNAKRYLVAFLSHCANAGLPVDFVSGHPYPAYYFSREGKWLEALKGPNQTREDAQWFRSAVLASGYPDAEIHLDEWCNSSIDRDLLHDTAFMAGFVLHNITNCAGLARSLTYWALTDLFEEKSLPVNEFHGGFGLISKSGFKKPAYYAYLYMSRLTGDVIDSGVNYVVAREGVCIRILAWNYCHYKGRYADGDKQLISYYDRYEAFDITEPIDFHFKLPAQNGGYVVEKVVFDREHGSVFDVWLKYGAIEYLTPNQLEIIKEQSIPYRKLSVCECKNGELELLAHIEPFGFVFYEAQPL